MKFTDNRLETVYRHYVARLQAAFSFSEAARNVDWLLEAYFELDRSQRMMNPDRRLSESELVKLHHAIERVEVGEPVQYVAGVSWFFGRRFKVAPGVLIPRPETEELVQWVLEEWQGKSFRSLDIGTGSGIIPITLALEAPNSSQFALDVSPEALQIAVGNSVHQNAGVEFFKRNVLKENLMVVNEPFDVVVSNPPYVLDSDREQMESKVLEWEPDLALFVSDHEPLIFYQAIAEKSWHCLKSGGALYFEIHEEFGDQIIAIFEGLGYVNVLKREDLNGKDRMVRGFKP